MRIFLKHNKWSSAWESVVWGEKLSPGNPHPHVLKAQTHTLAQCRPLNTHSLAIEIYRPERKGDGESVRASEVGKVGTGNVGSAKCVAQRVARFTFTLAGTFIQGHGADRTSQTTNGETQKQKDTCILYPHSGYCGYFRSVSYKYLNSVILNN